MKNINIITKSRKDLIILDLNFDAKGINLDDHMLNFLLKNEKPLTVFEIKECLVSKSESHASLILSNLIDSGLVIAIDEMRYVPITFFEKDFLANTKIIIKESIHESDKIIAGNYLKNIVENKNQKYIYHYKFYTSLAQIVCNENNFYWSRHLCSKKPIPDGLSFRSFFKTLIIQDNNIDFEHFKAKALKVFDTDEEYLHSVYNQYCNLIHSKKMAS